MINTKKCVEEAKIVRLSSDVFKGVLGCAEYGEKRAKNIPKWVDENIRYIILSGEERHRQIYFETLDNITIELNERMSR